jgi:general secretion pathway protein J
MRRRARAGFTLLEMLLTITLLSMIVGSILGGLHLGRRAWETGRTYEAVGEIEEASHAIADQLAHAAPLALTKGNIAQVVAFEGLPEGCRFIALSEGEAQWGGLILTEIAQADAPAADVAVWTRVYRPAEGFALPRTGMRMTSALRDAAYFRLSYFGEIEKGRPPAWTDRWIDRAALPLLVAVHVGGKRDGRVVDVSFTVALQLR